MVFVWDEGIREKLVTMIHGLSESLEIRLAEDFSEAYRIILEHRIDTLICGAGRERGQRMLYSVYHFIEIVRTVEQYYFTPVILLSNVEDPSNYCFRELHCFDVIEYPFHADRLLDSLRKALCYTTRGREEHMLYIQEENVLYPIPCSQIGYVQSTNHVMEVSLKNGSSRKLRYCTMQQLLDAADVGFLLQCSRSAIINMDYIHCIDYTNRLVTMQNRKQLPIGSTYVKALQKRFRKIQAR